MTDLVKRLRQGAGHEPKDIVDAEIAMDEAADEIERLRAAIKEALQCLSLEDNLGFATRELERALEQSTRDK